MNATTPTYVPGLRRLMFAAALLLCTTLARAQQLPVIPLWPGDAPGSAGQNAPEAVDARGTSQACTTRPSPSSSLPTGTSPEQRSWCAREAGIGTCRLNTKAMTWRAGSTVSVSRLRPEYRLARDVNSPYKVEVQAPDDARRALRVIRGRAAEWHVDPARLGIIGFSAGGEVVMYASGRYDNGTLQAPDPVDRQSARPDFQILIYPGPLGSELPVPSDAPPAFSRPRTTTRSCRHRRAPVP